MFLSSWTAVSIIFANGKKQSLFFLKPQSNKNTQLKGQPEIKHKYGLLIKYKERQQMTGLHGFDSRCDTAVDGLNPKQRRGSFRKDDLCSERNPQVFLFQITAAVEQPRMRRNHADNGVIWRQSPGG